MATQSGAQPMTVTVTSYYVPTPTAANTDSGSTSSSGGGGGSKKFVADATGAAVGGFALTCVIGWLLFQVWKRRHPTKWHRRRSDAENFPGWRRVTASKLYEANYDGVDESKSELSQPGSLKPAGAGGAADYNVISNSPPQLPSPVLSGNEKPLASRTTSTCSPLIELPTTPNFLNDYTLAALQWSDRNRSEGRLSLTSPPSPVQPSALVTPLLEVQPQPSVEGIEAATSESSHGHSHSQSSHTHYYHYQLTHQRPASASAYYSYGQPSTSRRSPSPTANRRSHSQQSFYMTTPAQQQGNSSSWHGHTTMLVSSHQHASWHGGPILPQNQHQNAIQGQIPPSSWNNTPNAGAFLSSHSSTSQPFFNTATSTSSAGARPINQIVQSSPAPRFFIPENQPLPPPPSSMPTVLRTKFSPPPSPHTPPRRLTCMNPDDTISLAQSQMSRPSSPEVDLHSVVNSPI